MGSNPTLSASGEMPEWPIGRDWKSRVAARRPWVRIPLSPPPTSFSCLMVVTWAPRRSSSGARDSSPPGQTSSRHGEHRVAESGGDLAVMCHHPGQLCTAFNCNLMVRLIARLQCVQLQCCGASDRKDYGDVRLCATLRPRVGSTLGHWARSSARRLFFSISGGFSVSGLF